METAEVGPWIVQVADGLRHARGITYADATRFEAPLVRATPTVPTEAFRRGPACPQAPSRLEGITGPVGDDLAHSENCLVLSVTAPVEAQGAPVMIWFHGGANVSGAGEAPQYDPDDLSRLGVVVISVTYRLGILGYLNPDPDGPGNLGLRDQLAALRWVAANVATFGGDPGNITIFGSSAGGDAVYCLLVSEEAEGLFRRAVIQSAPLGLRAGRDAMTSAMRARLTEALTDPYGATTAEILDAQVRVLEAAQRFGPVSGLAFAPTLGRDLLPHLSAISERLGSAARRIELLIGYTNDGAPFVTLHPRGERLLSLGPAGRFLLRQAARSARTGSSPNRQSSWPRSGAPRMAQRAPTDSTGRPPRAPSGACHCIELPFLFSGRAWRHAPMLGQQMPPSSLGPSIREAWVGFAHEGTAALPESEMIFA